MTPLLSLSLVAFISGVIGTCAATWLFPLVAICSWRRADPHGGELSTLSVPRSLAVLIPAHNEEQSIAHTLESVARARSALFASHPEVQARIIVGADGCTDGTVAIARSFGCEVIESRSGRGKWNTLVKLVHTAEQSEIVVLADSGILWPANLLVKILSEFSRSGRTIAVAPTYYNDRQGTLEAVHWHVERLLKRLEQYAGGPISVHGATVAWSGAVLRAGIKRLQGRRWRNDDVVLPLMARALFPWGVIRYLSDTAIHETSPPNPMPELPRRTRLLLGNFEWISSLLPVVWDNNRPAALLALRRVSRLLWAWWLLTLTAGGLGIAAATLFELSPAEGTVAGVFSPASGTFLIVVTALSAALMLLRSHHTFRRIFDSARVSLLAPIHFVSPSSRSIPWR